MTEPPVCVHDEEQSDGRQVWCSYCGTWLRDCETAAPMTAERLAELRSRITDTYACFDSMHRELLAEVVRLRAELTFAAEEMESMANTSARSGGYDTSIARVKAALATPTATEHTA